MTNKEKVIAARTWLTLTSALEILHKAKEVDDDYITCYIEEMNDSLSDLEYGFKNLPDEDENKKAIMEEIVQKRR